MLVLYVKALHVIFVICWYAALFYMPRLLIYHSEANQKEEPDRSILSKQLKTMQGKLWYIIGWPSLALSWLFGVWLIVLRWDDIYNKAWFLLKFIFVLGLTLYHLQTHFIFRQFQRDVFRWTSFRLRLFNEIATVILFVVIFLVIPKQDQGWVQGLLALLALAAALFLSVYFYKKHRQRVNIDK
jgi:putative membrane protein